MKYFTDNCTISSIKRQVYTGSKSTPTETGTTGTGYLRPLNEEQAALNGVQYGQAFSLIIECDVDIQESDIITVDTVIYTVVGMANHNRGGYTAYKKCLLTLPQKQ